MTASHAPASTAAFYLRRVVHLAVVLDGTPADHALCGMSLEYGAIDTTADATCAECVEVAARLAAATPAAEPAPAAAYSFRFTRSGDGYAVGYLPTLASIDAGLATAADGRHLGTVRADGRHWIATAPDGTVLDGWSHSRSDAAERLLDAARTPADALVDEVAARHGIEVPTVEQARDAVRISTREELIERQVASGVTRERATMIADARDTLQAELTRNAPAIAAVLDAPLPAAERPVDSIRQTIRREPAHEGVAGELALALLNAPDGHLRELDTAYAAHAATLTPGQQQRAAYVRTLIERRAWLRELIRRNDREVADRIPADRVRYASDSSYLESLDRQEANLRGQATEAREALARVGAAGPEYLPYGPRVETPAERLAARYGLPVVDVVIVADEVIDEALGSAEEQRQADADTATGTDADRVTISARARELRPGDLVVDVLGTRQYAAFDVQLDDPADPVAVRVWTAVADQERGLAPVLTLNARRELLVSRRLTPEQQVEARELFGD